MKTLNDIFQSGGTVVHPTVLQSKLLYLALAKWSNTEMQMELDLLTTPWQ